MNMDDVFVDYASTEYLPAVLGEPDSVYERAVLIADIVEYAYGSDVDEILDGMLFKAAREYVRHDKGSKHGGRFKARHTADSLSAIHDNIGEALRGFRTADSVERLVGMLEPLTVKQLMSLKADYGIAASGRKSDLVQKIADRLDRGRRNPPEPEPEPEPEPQPAGGMWAPEDPTGRYNVDQIERRELLRRAARALENGVIDQDKFDKLSRRHEGKAAPEDWDANMRVMAKSVSAFDRLFTKAQDCGTGDGGFKPGNDCAKGGTATAAPKGKASAKVQAWAEKNFGDELAENGRTKAENFTEWFGDSQVVDENGEPLTVYHGARNGALFNEFNPDRGAGTEYGIFTTPSKKYAEAYGRGKAMALMTQMRNPLIVTDKSEISSRDLTKADVEKLRAKGYDGIVSVNKAETYPGEYPPTGDFLPISKAHEIIAFDPTQIKSATGNAGNFDPSESDIRKHLQSAMELIPQGMLEVAQSNIQQVALHTAGMRSHVGVDAAGVWKGGMLHLDLSAIPESHRQGVCVHELAHAAEALPDGSNFADSAEWRKAWAAEIDRSDVPLTQYARTNSSEGFAEFVRFYAADTADARASFPRAARAVERVYGCL